MWWRRSPLVALSSALIAGALAVAVAPAAGAQQTDKQRQLSQGITEKSKAVQDAEAQAQGLQAQKARLDSTLSGLESQLAGAQDELAAAQADVDRLGFSSVLVSDQIDKTQQKLTSAANDARTSAVLLYKQPTAAGVIDLIGSTEGSGQFVEGKQYLERVAQKRRDDLARAERLRKALDEQKAELADQQHQADAARDQAAAKQQQVETLVAQQQQTRGALASNEAGLEATTATLKAEIANDEADLAAEGARVAALLQSLADTGSSGGGGSGGGTGSGDGGGSGGGTGSGQFLRPVSGATISSGFGYRTDPVTGVQAFHSGIDFAVGCGTPIKAAGNGVVVLVAYDPGGYGNYVVINHGGGMATLYGHQQAVAVSGNQTVTAGQVIGYVGSTGKSTGCHVHFEVRVNGNAVDPSGYL